MRAVVAHSGVVRSFYVRQRNHAVGNPIAMSFGRLSGGQFASESLAPASAFDRTSADAIANFPIAPSTRFRSKFNDKRAVRSRTFAAAAKVRAA